MLDSRFCIALMAIPYDSFDAKKEPTNLYSMLCFKHCMQKTITELTARIEHHDEAFPNDAYPIEKAKAFISLRLVQHISMLATDDGIIDELGSQCADPRNTFLLTIKKHIGEVLLPAFCKWLEDFTDGDCITAVAQETVTDGGPFPLTPVYQPVEVEVATPADIEMILPVLLDKIEAMLKSQGFTNISKNELTRAVEALLGRKVNTEDLDKYVSLTDKAITVTKQDGRGNMEADATQSEMTTKREETIEVLKNFFDNDWSYFQAMEKAGLDRHDVQQFEHEIDVSMDDALPSFGRQHSFSHASPIAKFFARLGVNGFTNSNRYLRQLLKVGLLNTIRLNYSERASGKENGNLMLSDVLLGIRDAHVYVTGLIGNQALAKNIFGYVFDHSGSASSLTDRAQTFCQHVRSAGHEVFYDAVTDAFIERFNVAFYETLQFHGIDKHISTTGECFATVPHCLHVNYNIHAMSIYDLAAYRTLAMEFAREYIYNTSDNRTVTDDEFSKRFVPAPYEPSIFVRSDTDYWTRDTDQMIKTVIDNVGQYHVKDLCCLIDVNHTGSIDTLATFLHNVVSRFLQNESARCVHAANAHSKKMAAEAAGATSK